MSNKWDWGKFWTIFAIIACVLGVIIMISIVAEANFFAVLGVAVAAFCAISALSLIVMWFIPKFEEWASEEGRKRAEKRDRKQ